MTTDSTDSTFSPPASPFEATVPSYLLAKRPVDLATALGAMLLEAISKATEAFEARIKDLESEVCVLKEELAMVEDNVDAAIEKALDNLEVEVTAEVNTRRYR